jgi:hypothetical protein
MTKKDLWLRIKNYHFDNIVHPSLWNIVIEKFGGTDASTKAFANKIADKHGWSNNVALATVREYRKFIYLGVVSDFIVTPSLLIDVVWHEHLLFSKAYREFCDTIIEFQFDHYPELLPTKMGTKKYEEQYANTIQLYIQEFGIFPPENVWGVTKFELQYDRQLQPQNISDRISNYINDQHLHFYFNDEKQISDSNYSEFINDTTQNNGDWDDDSDDGDGGSDGDGGDGGGCSGGCGGGD